MSATIRRINHGGPGGHSGDARDDHGDDARDDHSDGSYPLEPEEVGEGHTRL